MPDKKFNLIIRYFWIFFIPFLSLILYLSYLDKILHPNFLPFLSYLYYSSPNYFIASFIGSTLFLTYLIGRVITNNSSTNYNQEDKFIAGLSFWVNMLTQFILPLYLIYLILAGSIEKIFFTKIPRRKNLF